jgi:hypothetical protein
MGRKLEIFYYGAYCEEKCSVAVAMPVSQHPRTDPYERFSRDSAAAGAGRPGRALSPRKKTMGRPSRSTSKAPSSDSCKPTMGPLLLRAMASTKRLVAVLHQLLQDREARSGRGDGPGPHHPLPVQLGRFLLPPTGGSIGSRHAGVVARLTRELTLAIRNKVIVWTQNPIRLSPHPKRSPTSPCFAIARISTEALTPDPRMCCFSSKWPTSPCATTARSKCHCRNSQCDRRSADHPGDAIPVLRDWHRVADGDRAGHRSTCAMAREK